MKAQHNKHLMLRCIQLKYKLAIFCPFFTGFGNNVCDNINDLIAIVLSGHLRQTYIHGSNKCTAGIRPNVQTDLLLDQ